MNHVPTTLKLTLFLALMTTGCAHHQLRYQMSNQARTVHQTVEKQVLDNVAMFSAKPDSIPFFSYPNQGATNVDGSAALDGGKPLNPFFTTIGFSGSRSSGNSWTMTPVTSAFNLKCMREEFQRYTSSCDWLVTSSKRRDIPKCCTTYGEFCGCFVWVKPGCEDYFAQLVFAVLDAATKEEVTEKKNRKEVTIFIDENGKEASQEASVGKVQAIIDIDLDPIWQLTQGASTPEQRVKRAADETAAAAAAAANPALPKVETHNMISVPKRLYPRFQLNDLNLLQRQNTLGGSQFRRD